MYTNTDFLFFNRNRGQILEQGTHDELVAIPDGGYARLVAAQLGSRSASSANLSRIGSASSLMVKSASSSKLKDAAAAADGSKP